MAKVVHSKKACTVNPLKMSQPIGGALAFMGVDAAMPLLHGSQGCTSFGLVLFVRHFREAIPLQTTAMSEVATVLGGFENVEQAVLTIAGKTKPALIGICSTGVTETKGDDVEGYIRLIRQRHPELDDIGLVYVSTPDFKDAFQDGWAKTVTKMVEQLVLPTPDDAPRLANRVNLLPGCHLTPGDLDELRDILAAFGLEALILPDLSGSLDGHVPADFSPTTNGGITTAEIATMGRSCLDHRDRRADARRGAGVAGPNRRAVPAVRPADRPRVVRCADRLPGRDHRPAGAGKAAAPAQPVGRRDAGRAFLLRRQDASRSARSRICCGASAPGSPKWAARSAPR